MEIKPGYYWVFQHEKSDKPTISRLTKSSGWEYFYSEHSTKMISNKPWKVLQAIKLTVGHSLDMPLSDEFWVDYQNNFFK